MKKNLLFLSFLFFSLHDAFPQTPLVKQWDYGFGGSADDLASGFQKTVDGGFIFNGSSASGISGDKTQASQGGGDCWFVKIDSLGIKQWDKSFGGAGNDYQRTLIQTADGGYVSGGRSSSGISGNKTQASQGGYDYWIVKMDAARNIIWDKDYGSTMDDYFLNMKPTMDGGYIFGGWTLGGIGGDKTQPSKGSSDCWVVKIDSLGVKQWDKDYGGAGDDFLYSIQTTNDGGYLLGAWTNSSLSGDMWQATKGGYDYWIMKIDSLGVIKWQANIGGSGDDALSTMDPTPDGGYIIGGRSYSPVSGDKSEPNRDPTNNTLDYWIVKIDSLGIKQWDKTFGGTAHEDDIDHIYQTMDGGYLISGTSYSPLSADKTESNLGTEQTWIVKTDAVGKKQWDKTLHTNSTTTHDEMGLAVQTSDGCYVFANYTIGGMAGDKSAPSRGGIDYWVIKFCDTTQSIPKASFISSDSAFCNENGGCIDFTDLSSGNPTSWKWLFPGAVPDTSTLQYPTNICYYTPGTYSVTLIVSNGSGSDTLFIPKMIIFSGGAAPPIVTQNGDTLCCNPQAAYQWYLNGSPIPGATNQCYVVIIDGSYGIYITDSIGCSRIMNLGCLGCFVSQLNTESFDIYPNPASEYLTINIGMGLLRSARNDIVDLNIYNALGEKVLQSELIRIASVQQSEINVASLTKGIYIVEVNDGARVYRAKFVKK